MAFFKKKKEQKPIMQVKTRKCPVCGEIVEFYEYDSENLEYFMDGQPKLSFNEVMRRFCICKKCGYITNPYVYKDEDKVQDVVKEFVYSDEYQNAINTHYNTDGDKFIALVKMLQNAKGNIVAISHDKMYELWLYRENNTDVTSKIKDTIKQIEDLQHLTHLTKVYPSQLYYTTKTSEKNKEMVYIGKNEQLIDLYRQIGNFKKAEEILNHCFKSYNFQSDDSALFTYLKQEEKLIKEKSMKHI